MIGGTIRSARPEDSPVLLAMMEEQTDSRNFSLLSTRRPNPYDSYCQDSPHAQITVYEDKQGVLSAQLAVLPRWLYVQGVPKNVGYITGLHRREGNLIPLHQILRHAWEECVCEDLFCSVLDNNPRVQTLFERPRNGLPLFQRLCSYKTYLLGPKALMKLGNSSMKRNPAFETEEFLPKELLTFLAHEGSRQTGFPQIDRLENYAHLEATDFITLRDGNEVVAACAVWDQRSFKQYIVTKYHGLYRLAFRLGSLLKTLGYFALPKKGTVAPCLQISFLLAKEDDPSLLKQLLAYVGSCLLDQGGFACIGAPLDSVLYQVLEPLPAISFTSTLFGTKGLSRAASNPAEYTFQCALL